MIELAWHVFLVLWISGCTVYVVRRYERTNSKALQREVRDQVLRTRIAELQARERKALDTHAGR